MPVLSFTSTRATSVPSAHQCRTQAPFSNDVDDVILAFARVYRAIQSRTFGEVPAIVSARFFVSRCVSSAPGFTLAAVTTLSLSRTVRVARTERDGSLSRAIQVRDAGRYVAFQTASGCTRCTSVMRESPRAIRSIDCWSSVVVAAAADAGSASASSTTSHLTGRTSTCFRGRTRASRGSPR